MAGYALPALTEEAQVLASCRSGDVEGLDLLYRRYAPALVAFCQHRLGNAGDAEDAAHEAILKAHRALPRFREGARLWPWLATIAANVCTDMQRSRERIGPEQDGIDCFAPEVDEDVSQRLRVSIVEAALEELPERFRTPLFLREFMGWSYEEIADFSNKSIGSVRTTLMRARRAMQTRIEDVARRRGQWPLPAAVAGGWRRLRETVRSWRDSVSRAGADAANALWRAEGLLGGLGSGLQAAAVAVAAAGTLMAAGSAGASLDGALPASASRPSVEAAVGSLPAWPASTAAKSSSDVTPQAPQATEAPHLSVTTQSQALAPEVPPVATDTGIKDSDDGHLDLYSEVVADIPGIPHDQSRSTLYLNCKATATRQEMCRQVRALNPPSAG